MPSLRNSRRRQAVRSGTRYVIGVEIRHTASSDRLASDQDIQFETRVLIICMRRRFQDRQVLEQQHRILDGIYGESELNPGTTILDIPVTETNRRQFAVRNGLRQTSGTGFCFGAVEMDHMAACYTGRTVIHRGHLDKIIIGVRVCGEIRRIGDIARSIIQIQIIDTELIGVVDELGDDGLEAEIVIAALCTNDEVSLSDRQTGEVGLRTGHDLRSCPDLSVIGIGTNLVLGSCTLPFQRDGGTVRSDHKVRRLIARLSVGNKDIID